MLSQADTAARARQYAAQGMATDAIDAALRGDGIDPDTAAHWANIVGYTSAPSASRPPRKKSSAGMVTDQDSAPMQVKFGDAMLANGYTSVPNLVLKHYAAAGITEGEMLFTIVIWQFWWGKRLPFPSLGLIAKYMGKDIRQVRRYEHSLVEKGLLTVQGRVNVGERKGRSSNVFDFSPMLAAILRLAHAAGDLETAPDASSGRRIPYRPDRNVRTGPGKNVRSHRTRMSAEEYKDE